MEAEQPSKLAKRGAKNKEEERETVFTRAQHRKQVGEELEVFRNGRIPSTEDVERVLTPIFSNNLCVSH